eukprot:GHVU01062308.1.p1 GENE.GHVU01062308.1~~GHVU01062308.1.p1  ORF type:complete len:268 (+),score=23.75 GHVU01062308.1:154-957(+)
MYFAILLLVGVALVNGRSEPVKLEYLNLTMPYLCPLKFMCLKADLPTDVKQCRKEVAIAKHCYEKMIDSDNKDFCPCEASDVTSQLLQIERAHTNCGGLCYSQKVADCHRKEQNVYGSHDPSRFTEAAECMENLEIDEFECLLYGMTLPKPQVAKLKALQIISMTYAANGCNLMSLQQSCIDVSRYENICRVLETTERDTKCILNKIKEAGSVCDGIEDSAKEGFAFQESIYRERCKIDTKIRQAKAGCEQKAQMKAFLARRARGAF